VKPWATLPCQFAAGINHPDTAAGIKEVNEPAPVNDDSRSGVRDYWHKSARNNEKCGDEITEVCDMHDHIYPQARRYELLPNCELMVLDDADTQLLPKKIHF
jgi:hypothetical protein